VIHALALQVVVPLAAAPLCLLLRSGLAAALLATGCGVFGLANAIWLLTEVVHGGTIRYAFGGVAMPYGIEYRLDLVGAYVLVVLAAVVAVTTAWAARTRVYELGGGRRDLFFAAWQTCAAGLFGITVTGDLFNVFVFLEISSLSTYALVAHGTEHRALVASFRYLLMGTVGATFILIGIGLLYAMTGTLNMLDLAQRLPQVSESRAVRSALAFISVGLCLKVAVFPLHLWLPNAYACAPAPVSAMLAGTATKVALYLWLRFFYTVFAPSESFVELPIDSLLLPLGLVGALIGSLIAVFQDEPKRLLAWSSIAQIGYLVVGLSLATRDGIAATLSHLASHALVKTALFLALGAVVVRTGAVGRPLYFSDLHGLGRRMPKTSAAILVAGLGLIGMPLTSGFVSKWLLIRALLASEEWIAVVVIVLSSLLALVYVGRLIEAIYFTKPADSATFGIPAPAIRLGHLATFLLWSLCLASLALGVWTEFNVGIAERAAAMLFGGAR
jgi:multicomponent Na+:H+ antiporter subunit D